MGEFNKLFGVNQAQALMRSDLEQEAQKLGDVLAGVIGSSVQSTPVTELALEIIDNAPSLVLTFKQWAVVQHMIEAGIRTGVALQGGVTG